MPQHLTFGQFAAALADFDASSLVTVLPDFHNLGMRFSQLQAGGICDDKTAGRLAECQSLVDFCLAQQGLVDELEQLYARPYRLGFVITTLKSITCCIQFQSSVA